MSSTRVGRRRHRRRSRSTRTYSLEHLIERQPKTLAKQPAYTAALRHFRANPRLQQARISGRGYTLLNGARISAENLHHFYRTYRLPADPFFPLFLAAKRAYIMERMRSLPPQTLAMVRYLGYLERIYNRAEQSPVWQRELFPGSKRKADTLAAASDAVWFTRASPTSSSIESWPPMF